MDHASSFRLGIDLGGTKIHAVVIDDEGLVIGEARVRTEAEKGYHDVVGRLALAAQDAIADAKLPSSERIGSVGLGVPGPVDPINGRVLVAFNLHWGEQPVAEDLGKLLGRRVVLGNDVNLGALGEVTHGAAIGCDDAVALFMGTGLGGGIIESGRILNGRHGFAGEIGHVRAPFDNALCSCGRHGCLETVASRNGIARMLREAVAAGQTCVIGDLSELRSSQLAQAWRANCATTREALRRSARGLAWGLVALGSVVDPQVFVLGGGVIEALGPELLPVVSDEMRELSPFYHTNPPDVRLAALGDDAVAVGAAVASAVGQTQGIAKERTGDT